MVKYSLILFVKYVYIIYLSKEFYLRNLYWENLYIQYIEEYNLLSISICVCVYTKYTKNK